MIQTNYFIFLLLHNELFFFNMFDQQYQRPFEYQQIGCKQNYLHKELSLVKLRRT